MSYKGHRTGSVRGEIHECFDRLGEEATLKLGKERHIKEKRIVRWISRWKRSPSILYKRVCSKHNPEHKGYRIATGDQQSEVKWDDGTQYAVINKDIVEIPA